MKKIIYIFLLSLSITLFTSCEKDEIGGTATEQLAGEWVVTVIAVDANDAVIYSDDELFGIGHFPLLTYNTAANQPSEMWIDDSGNFWDFKAIVNADVTALTFNANAVKNAAYDCKVTIKDGKILKGAATTPSGMPADSIYFHVNFDDDGYPEAYGYDSYRIAGYRYTGFAGDE